MEKVFIDTNIIIDLLAKREPFYKDAQDLFTLSDKKEIHLCISSLSFANAYYSIAKHHKEVDAKKYLAKFKVLVTVLALEDKAIIENTAASISCFMNEILFSNSFYHNFQLV